MRDKEKQRHYAYEALHILLLLALLLFITRLWPILLLVILVQTIQSLGTKLAVRTDRRIQNTQNK